MTQLIDTFKGKKVIITGHTGFKGSWLSLWLLKLGANVEGISLNVPTTPSHFESTFLNKAVKDHRIDIRDSAKLSKVISKAKPDFIFHLAAQALVKDSYVDPLTTWEVNTIGTVNMLNTLRLLDSPCMAVFITSDKCYDNVEWEWGYRESDRLGGPDPYSASKGSAEIAIKSFARSYFADQEKIRIAVGRAGNVIGGGDWAQDRLVPDCMQAWSKKEVVPIRNPDATRPWQHVLEPLSGYLNLAIALNKNEINQGDPFNFGPPAEQNYSVADLVNAMSAHWNKVQWKDLSSNYIGPYESNLLKLNCDKALNQLGWKATWNFESTVRETVLWYKDFYENDTKAIIDTSLKQIENFQYDALSQKIPWTK